MRNTGQQGESDAGMDGYGARTAVARPLQRRHDDAVVALVRRIDPSGVHDVGCGDGSRVLRWTRGGLTAKGSDDSGAAIDCARDRAVAEGFDDSLFCVRSVYHLDVQMDAADVVVCCGLLERVANPDLALRRLQIAADRYFVVSIGAHPWANLFRLACGSHWSSLGRPASQVNRWSRRAFVDLISQYFVVEQVLRPLPWTILLCRAQTDTQVVRHLGSP